MVIQPPVTFEQTTCEVSLTHTTSNIWKWIWVNNLDKIVLKDGVIEISVTNRPVCPDVNLSHPILYFHNIMKQRPQQRN